jgi:hypothetical protein
MIVIGELVWKVAFAVSILLTTISTHRPLGQLLTEDGASNSEVWFPFEEMAPCPDTFKV